jgi:uncharacterized cofD-like protein
VTAAPRVVAIGGGHGLAATIRAVRGYAACTTAVVATADDGGSTGRLRAGLPLPAPGDLRRCVAAMAADPEAPLARALEYRFGGTDVEGHALGNLLLAGLAEATGDFGAAVRELCRLVGLDPARERVVPATTDPVVLIGETASGEEVVGQVAVSSTLGVTGVRVEPVDAPAPAEVAEAVAAANQVVLGPGSLYTSVLAAATVDDVRDAVKQSPGPRVYVCNLRAELGETRGYDVAAHVAALRRHGIEPDVVLAQRGSLPTGDLDCPLVEADVARPHGLSHDAAKLGEVLRGLVP